MNCPLCHIGLQKILFNNIEVDYCPKCLGMWFEQDELQQAKDAKDEKIRWLDIDLWEKESLFRIAPKHKLCPACRLPLYEVRYGDSDITVDVCNICYGIWLDKGEFQNIMDYLKQRADWKVLHEFGKSAAEEFLEIFSGPESLRDELQDFVVLLKLFVYKFTAQHPLIAQLISQWPR